MDKKILTIIILVIIIVLLFFGMIVYFTLNEKANKDYRNQQVQQLEEWTTSIKKYLKEQDASDDKRFKALEEYYKNKKPEIITKYITNDELMKMTIAEKDKTIVGLQDDKKNLKTNLDSLEARIKSDTIDLDSFRKKLETTNNKLISATETIKNFGYARWGFEVNEFLSVDNQVNINTNTSIIIKRYFFEGHFFVGGGAGFLFGKNPLTNATLYGGSLNFSIGGNFK